MYEATDYASGATAVREEQIAREAPATLLGDAINEPFHKLDDVLGDLDLGDEFRGRLVTDVPTLLVSGKLDVRTPVSNAQELLPDLANSQLLSIDGVSHDLAYRGDHIDELTNVRDQFLRGETVNIERLSSSFAFLPIENNNQ
jgi:pimeloyl-ACP methyl ester carboxylesterase